MLEYTHQVPWQLRMVYIDRVKLTFRIRSVKNTPWQLKSLFSMSRSIFSLDSFNKKSSQYACSTSLVFIGSFWTNYVFEVKWISQNIFDQHAKQSFWYIVRWQIIFLIHLTGQVDKKITPSINQGTSEKSRWISDLLYILFFESDFKINRNNN